MRRRPAALSAWKSGSQDAAAVWPPTLSVLVAETGLLLVEGAALLRSWLPKVEDLTVQDVGRHPIAAV